MKQTSLILLYNGHRCNQLKGGKPHISQMQFCMTWEVYIDEVHSDSNITSLKFECDMLKKCVA